MVEPLNPLLAVIEIVGKKRIAGEVRERKYCNVPMIEVSVPATATQPAFTRVYAPGAIFSVTPLDSAEVLLKIATHLNEPPIPAGLLPTPPVPFQSPYEVNFLDLDK